MGIFGIGDWTGTKKRKKKKASPFERSVKYSREMGFSKKASREIATIEAVERRARRDRQKKKRRQNDSVFF